MARLTVRVLKILCLTVSLMIAVDVIVVTMKIGPPPVPLDPEGHMAPYSESPFFGI